MKQKNETNQVLGSIRLSMSEYIKGLAKARANYCFSGNISAYIAHLILQDVERNGKGESIANDRVISGNGIIFGSKNVKSKAKIKK